MDRPFEVLFLSVRNSARSIMAEAILNKHSMSKFRAYSAGSQPQGRVDLHAIQLLRNLGYDTRDLRPKSWAEIVRPGVSALDFVFTVCDRAEAGTSEVWPGQPVNTHWAIPDPAGVKGSHEIVYAYMSAYRMLFQCIRAFTALPIRDLDQQRLREQLEKIGRMEGATI